MLISGRFKCSAQYVPQWPRNFSISCHIWRIWRNCMLVPRPVQSVPFSRGSMDLPLALHRFISESLEFFLNVFSEFSDKNICHYSKRTRTCQLFCERPECYHSASKTHVRGRIFKLSSIHTSVIFKFSEFVEFSESSALFKKNSILLSVIHLDLLINIWKVIFYLIKCWSDIEQYISLQIKVKLWKKDYNSLPVFCCTLLTYHIFFVFWAGTAQVIHLLKVQLPASVCVEQRIFFWKIDNDRQWYVCVRPMLVTLVTFSTHTSASVWVWIEQVTNKGVIHLTLSGFTCFYSATLFKLKISEICVISTSFHPFWNWFFAINNTFFKGQNESQISTANSPPVGHVTWIDQ